MATTFAARYPDYEARIRDSLELQGFSRLIGLEVESVAPGRCVLGVPFRDDVAQQHGFFHGGLISTPVDNAGAYAAFTLPEAGQSMLTAEFKVTFLRPGLGERLRATGDVVRHGRRMSVSEVKVHALDAGKETLIAVALVSMMPLLDRGDS